MSETRQNLFSDRSTVLHREMIIKAECKDMMSKYVHKWITIFPKKLFINLLEMYPSFPCRKRGHKRAWFEVLVDCCYCGSIQRDCQLEIFSVMRDGAFVVG